MINRVALPLAGLGLLVVPQVLLAERLPSRLAIHWGLDWRPDGSMPEWLSLGLLSAMWVVVWLIFLRPFERDRASVAFEGERAAWAAGGVLLAVQSTVLVKNLDAPHWAAAEPISIGNVLLIAAPPVAVWVSSTLWWRRAGRVAVGDSSMPGNQPRTRPWQRVLAVGVLPAVLVIVVLGAGARQWVLAWVVAGFVVLDGLAFSTVRAVVTDGGVRVTLGPWGWPRWVIPAASLRGAEAIWVEPLAFGGWGLRRSWTTTAVIVRGGEAVRVKRANGRDLVATVDHAEKVAAAINDLAAQS